MDILYRRFVSSTIHNNGTKNLIKLFSISLNPKSNHNAFIKTCTRFNKNNPVRHHCSMMNYLAPSSKNNSFNISKFGGQLLNNCDLFEKSDCRSISRKIKKSKPVFKSQPVPELNSGSVKEAEANNFDELVYKNHKDTLVVFYAFWCRRCKMLAPIYEEVGKMMKNEDVDIVKIDATSYDIPKKFKVYFYPTLYWLPKLYKENHIRYKAGINTIDLVKFIAENSTKELKGYDRLGNSKHIKHSDTKKIE